MTNMFRRDHRRYRQAGHARDRQPRRNQRAICPGTIKNAEIKTYQDNVTIFAEKAYWLQRDGALKAFVDQWLHISVEDGSFKRIYAAWFE